MHTTVAYLGPAGTFTEAALLQFDLGEVTGLPVSSPSEALGAVRSGAAQYAVVAIENSVDGAVTATFDALVESDERVQVFGEVDLPVEFAIMVRPGSRDRAKFATHPVAYQQVRSWIAQELPDAAFTPASSNAAAAEMVAQGEADVAAAPARAAEIYGLEIIESGVADVRGAATRFLLVGAPAAPPSPTGSDRTSVVFTLPNQPGSLVGALEEFAIRGVDLTRIESRPTRREFGTYRFYADLVGHIEDEPVAEALRALWLRTEELVFVGSWPAAQELDSSRRLAAADEWVARARRGQ